MSADTEAPAVTLEFALDAPPDKIWRALTVPEYLDAWLLPLDGQDRKTFAGKDAGLAEIIQTEVIEARRPEHLRLAWRERGDNSAGDSTLTFTLTPHEGGTWVKLVQTRTTLPVPANGNAPPLALAA